MRDSWTHRFVHYSFGIFFSGVFGLMGMTRLLRVDVDPSDAVPHTVGALMVVGGLELLGGWLLLLDPLARRLGAVLLTAVSWSTAVVNLALGHSVAIPVLLGVGTALLLVTQPRALEPGPTLIPVRLRRRRRRA